jgi:hypothetical protein
MVIGHYAPVMAANRVAPSTSLGTRISAAIFLDLLWPVLVLLGIEIVTIAPGATASLPWEIEIPAPAERMRMMRERRRRRGLRELRLVVPDPRLLSVRRRVAAQVVRLDRHNEDAALRWIETVSEFDTLDSAEQ